MISKKIKTFAIAITLATSVGAALTINSTKYNKTSADNEYPVLPLNEYSSPANFAGGGMTYSNGVVNLVAAAYCGAVYSYSAGGSYGYTAKISSSTAEASDKVFFSIGDTNTKIGTSQDFLNNTGGYQVTWGEGGTQFILTKAGATLTSVSAPIFTANTQYNIEFHMIDVDENSTRLLFKVGGTTYLDYIDTNSPLKPTPVNGVLDNVIWTVWNTLTITDVVIPHESDIGSLTSMSSGIPYCGSVVNIGTETTEILSGEYSGVTYKYSTNKSYGYKVKVHTQSNTTNVIMHFIIGDSLSKTWTAADLGVHNGFKVEWSGWGTSLVMTDGGGNVVGSKIISGVQLDTDYDIEYVLYDIGDGLTKVVFKLNDEVVISALVKGFSFTPDHGVFYNSIYTQYTYLTIYNDILFNKSGISTAELGKPTLMPDSQSVDLNGNVQFNNGIISYKKELKDTIYEFKIRFNKINGGADSALILMLNYRGTPDTRDGANWSTKGYALVLYPNGMREMSKGGKTVIAPDWYGNPLVKDTDYTIKVGTYNPFGNAVKFVCYVNGNKVLDYEDSVNPIDLEGAFTIQADRAAGTLSVLDCPDINLTGVPEQGFIGDDYPLGYSGAEVGDTVEYFVDSDRSTATGHFNDNVLHIDSRGVLYFYARVNGYYSNVSQLNCYKVGAVFVDLPSEFTVGSGTLKANVIITTGVTIQSITYSLVVGSNIATIDENGVVTPTGVGAIRIQADALCEGDIHYITDGEEGNVIIKPAISFDLEEIYAGDPAPLAASINANNTNNDEFTYKIIGHPELATIENGVITGIRYGTITLQVTFAEGKDYETFLRKDISVVGAQLILPPSPIIYGNGDGQLSAQYPNGKEAETIKYYVENGTGKATINEDTGEIHYLAAGTVSVYAVLDSKYESMHATLVINPKVELSNVLGMAVGAERDLTYVANCPLPENEDIDVSFELLSEIDIDGNPGDVVDFDEETGHVYAKAIGKFTVKVNVVGETFYGVTLLEGTQIAIENPIVVVTSTVEDMYVGQTQLIEATFGNGEIKDVTQSIEVLSGADLVTVDGMNITAIGVGDVTFRVVANGVAGLVKEMNITTLAVSLVAGNMNSNEEQILDYVINSNRYEVNKVEYSIVSGAELATLENNKLTSGNRPGYVEVKVVINDTLEDVVKIHINKDAYIVGVNNGENVHRGDVYQLKALNEAENIAANATFQLEGTSASLVDNQNGTAVLTITGGGELTINIIINNVLVDSIKLNAIESALESIELGTASFKTIYDIGELFDRENLVVTAKFSDQTTEVVTDYEVSGFNSQEVGEQEITITYNGKTAKVTITVINKALNKAKDAAKAELDEVDLSVYRDAEKNAVTNLINAGKNVIDSCNSIDEVNAKLSEIKSSISAVKTDEQYKKEEAAALADAKTKALSDLQSFYNGLDRSKYSEQNLGIIDLLYLTSKAYINSATSIEEVTDIIASIQLSINGIEQIPQKKGCGGSIEATSIILSAVCLAGICLFVVKKERKHYEK